MKTISMNNRGGFFILKNHINFLIVKCCIYILILKDDFIAEHGNFSDL